MIAPHYRHVMVDRVARAAVLDLAAAVVVVASVALGDPDSVILSSSSSHRICPTATVDSVSVAWPTVVVVVTWPGCYRDHRHTNVVLVLGLDLPLLRTGRALDCVPGDAHADDAPDDVLDGGQVAAVVVLAPSSYHHHSDTLEEAVNCYSRSRCLRGRVAVVEVTLW